MVNAHAKFVWLRPESMIKREEFLVKLDHQFANIGRQPDDEV